MYCYWPPLNALKYIMSWNIWFMDWFTNICLTFSVPAPWSLRDCDISLAATYLPVIYMSWREIPAGHVVHVQSSACLCQFCIVWYAAIQNGFLQPHNKDAADPHLQSQKCVFTSALRAVLNLMRSGSWQGPLTPRCFERAESCSLPHQKMANAFVKAPDSMPI